MAVEYTELITGLKNRNPEPALFTDGEVTFPYFLNSYDWGEQDRILRQIDIILANAEDAWMPLLESFENDSYSMTFALQMHVANFSVGDICQTIVFKSLMAVYAPHIPAGEVASRKLSSPRLIPSGGLKKWCLAQRDKGKRLFELQIELGEWAIDVIEHTVEIEPEKRESSVGAIKAECDRTRKEQKAVIARTLIRKEVFRAYAKEEASRLREQIDSNNRFKPKRESK